jgi:hypothetical protein
MITHNAALITSLFKYKKISGENKYCHDNEQQVISCADYPKFEYHVMKECTCKMKELRR